MQRNCTVFLIDWLNSNIRKPLILRGARQVGKTWIVRHLAEVQQRQLIELNFEKRPDLQTLFVSNNPEEILINIAAFTGKKIDPSQAILFLDEIQAAPQLLEKLRWFAEDMPQLPVIAAGSLLDFALAEHEFSMPVGRINYFYLEPLSFEEFLDAIGHHELRGYLQRFDWNMTIPEAIHLQFIKYIKEYLIIGGMPAAVMSWKTEHAPHAITQIHFDLLATYRDDFAKYTKRLSIARLEDVINAIPRQLGRKFVYSHVNAEVSATSLKQALDLMAKARVCHRIIATAANGLPLGAEINEKFLKAILLDCGLCCASLGLSLHQLVSISEIAMIHQGGLAEQLAGQILRTIEPPYIPPSLYYWQREKKGALAEVDYIIQHEGQIVPIEVKAGSTGSLKSLRVFISEKKKPLAVRVNSDRPSLYAIQCNDSANIPIKYQLLSIPFYLLGQVHRLIASAGQFLR